MSNKFSTKLLIYLLTLLSLTYFSCENNPIVYQSGSNIITNTLLLKDTCFTNTTIIEGHGCDNLVIENCCFSTPQDQDKHYGLVLQDVRNVTIRNCRFANINHIALMLGNQNKSCENVLIENNTFHDIGGDAINTYSNAVIGGVVRHNHIYNIGLDTLTYASLEGAFHGIYWKDKDVLIEDNHIHHNFDKGSAITVRAGATIRRNIIHNTIHGINYTANYNANGSGLLIENNLLYDCRETGITLSGSNNILNDISFAHIKFNTIVGNNLVGIQTVYLNSFGAGNPNPNFSVIGNIVVNQNINGLIINGATTNPLIEGNYTSANIENLLFVNSAKNDFHLQVNSVAHNKGGITSEILKDDLEKKLRPVDKVDIGCYEY